LQDGIAFTKELLHRAGVGLAPGEAFGKEGKGFVRACFAVDPERMDEALRRLDKAFRK